MFQVVYDTEDGKIVKGFNTEKEVDEFIWWLDKGTQCIVLEITDDPVYNRTVLEVREAQ